MAHYCVFCERSYVTFTKLRNHTCKPSHQDFIQLTDIDSEEEKENWIKTPFEQEFRETNSEVSFTAMEEENYAGIKSEFDYTVELTHDVGSDNENNLSPALTKMLQGRTESNFTNEVMENVGEDSNEVRSESDENSDYVYVLEPDNSISFNHDNQNESKTKVPEKDYGHGDNQSKSEVHGAIDLSGSNKRKRKSNLNSALSHILKKTKTVNQQKGDIFKESHSEEIHANKVQIIEKAEKEINQNVPSDISASELVKDFSIKTEPCAAVGTPKVSLPTFSTPNTGSGRKNRRKRSVPVRCEKNEEIEDISEIMEEYGVQSDIKANQVRQDFTEKANNIAPLDLTPKACGNTDIAAVANIPMAPMDLTASGKSTTVDSVIKTEPTKCTEPVDLSKPVPNSMPNGMKNGFTNGGLLPPVLPNMSGFDPIQMRQLFESVYKMQAQFPNQNLVQAQLMQFHALMQNAMLNGGMMPLNNLNGMKNGKNVKSDKNDNIIKTEPGLSQGLTTNEFQKFNLEQMHKNGLIQNNFAPPFNGLIPGSPFTMNQTNQFKNRSAKRKSKDLLLINESNLQADSIKLETSTSLGLVGLDGKQSPEQILETLSKFFPVVPIESLPKTQIGDDINCARFFVKDNEQIRVIVDSLLQVGVLDFDEQQIHGTEPVYKYICRVCSQTFFHVEHLTKHIKKSHVVKKYQCSECDRSFHDAGNYRQHMRVHDETDIPYECPECQRRFRHKCTLKVHMRIHTGEKPFRCDICDATFKISSGLQTHMRKHTGETPYACEFCDLRFKCQSNLKQHLFQHTQVRPFPCEICGKTYSRKSIRDAHLLTHTKDSVKNEHVKKWIDSMPAQALAVGGND